MQAHWIMAFSTRIYIDRPLLRILAMCFFQLLCNMGFVFFQCFAMQVSVAGIPTLITQEVELVPKAWGLFFQTRGWRCTSGFKWLGCLRWLRKRGLQVFAGDRKCCGIEDVSSTESIYETVVWPRVCPLVPDVLAPMCMCRRRRCSHRPASWFVGMFTFGMVWRFTSVSLAWRTAPAASSLYISCRNPDTVDCRSRSMKRNVMCIHQRL